MKTVYSASNLSIVSIFQNILEGYGVDCLIKNEFLHSVIGDILPIESWPQLCVDDDDCEEAKRIVDGAHSKKNLSVLKWFSCSEVIDGQFSECWNCGNNRFLL